MHLHDIAGLAVFAKVVERESFSRAADDLGLSKSSVSKQINALENRLGARLLNRTTRRLSLTDVGARLLERSQRIIAEAEAAAREAGDLHSQPTGTLRISVGMSFGLLHLAPALAQFLPDYPDLAVSVDLNDRFVDLVDEGYDIALRIGRLETSTLIQRRLSPVRILTVAAPDYLERQGEPRHPQDLADHACISYSYVLGGTAWRYAVAEAQSRVRIEPKALINNGDAITRMVEDGAGITQMPSFIVHEGLRAGRLKEILPDFEPTPLGLFAVYPHGRNLTVKVRVFIDFLARRFTATPYWDEALPAP